DSPDASPLHERTHEVYLIGAWQLREDLRLQRGLAVRVRQQGGFGQGCLGSNCEARTQSSKLRAAPLNIQKPARLSEHLPLVDRVNELVHQAKSLFTACCRLETSADCLGHMRREHVRLFANV